MPRKMIRKRYVLEGKSRGEREKKNRVLTQSFIPERPNKPKKPRRATTRAMNENEEEGKVKTKRMPGEKPSSRI